MNLEFREGSFEDLATLAEIAFYNNGGHNRIRPEDVLRELTTVKREWFLSLAVVEGTIIAYDIRLQRGEDWVAVLRQDVMLDYVNTPVLHELCEYANKRVAEKGFLRTQWGVCTRQAREIGLAKEYGGNVIAYHEQFWFPQYRQSLPVLFFEAPVQVARQPFQAVRGRIPDELQVTEQAEREFQVTQAGRDLGRVQVSYNMDHVLLEAPEQPTPDRLLAVVAVGKHLAASGHLIAVPSHRADYIAALASFGNYVVGFVGEGMDRNGFVMIQ